MESAQIHQIDPGYLKVTGTLSLTTVSALKDAGSALITVGPRESSIDLSEALFDGSAGLALLISWLRAAAESRKQIVYVNPPERLRKIAEISGIGEILKLDQD